MRISFLPHAREVAVEPGESVMQAAREADLPIDAACGGRGVCGACRVRFVDGAPEPGAWDRLHLREGELAEGVRLGCMARVARDAIVSAPRRGRPIQLDGRTSVYKLSPPSRRARVRASAPDLRGVAAGILPDGALGSAPRELTLHTLGSEVRAVELGWGAADRLGVAVWAQGECLRGWLLDLETGTQLAARTSKLIGWPRGESSGSAGVAAAVRRLARSLCSQARRRAEDVSDVVLLGATRGSVADTGTMPARLVGGGEDPLVDTACACAAAAGVGADEPAVLIAIEPYPWALCLDGERGWLAAAPAWRCEAQPFAATGGPGTIEQVRLGPGVELHHTSGAPRALSVAGAVECVAELRRLGLLDRRGRLAACPPPGTPHELAARLGGTGGAAGFRLWAGDGRPAVGLRHEHVRSVQRLRASVRAVLDGVLERSGVGAEDLVRVLLVGAEAANLDVWSLSALGMLPDVPPSLVQPLASAAGAGARLALLSAEASRDIELLARRCVRLPDIRVGQAWAEGLYLDLHERGGAGATLDGAAEALLDFPSRGSVGIGRRA